MSNARQMFNSGKAHGEGEGKVDQWTRSAKDTASSMKDGASNATQAAQAKNDHAAGMLQQTGEHMKQMAQEAADAVKNAVAMGNAKASSTANETINTTASKH